jgi:hypothetical protein
MEGHQGGSFDGYTLVPVTTTTTTTPTPPLMAAPPKEVKPEPEPQQAAPMQPQEAALMSDANVDAGAPEAAPAADEAATESEDDGGAASRFGIQTSTLQNQPVDPNFVDNPMLSAQQRVQAAMNAWGVSQTIFGQAAGAHQSALSLWLRGRQTNHAMEGKFLDVIHRGFGCLPAFVPPKRRGRKPNSERAGEGGNPPAAANPGEPVVKRKRGRPVGWRKADQKPKPAGSLPVPRKQRPAGQFGGGGNGGLATRGHFDDISDDEAEEDNEWVMWTTGDDNQLRAEVALEGSDWATVAQVTDPTLLCFERPRKRDETQSAVEAPQQGTRGVHASARDIR